MTSPEKEKPPDFYSKLFQGMTAIIIVVLAVLFLWSLPYDSILILDNNKLVLLGFIVVLLLSYRFKEIEVTGFFKLSKAVEEVNKETKAVKEETKELRQILVQSMAISSSVSKSSAQITINQILSQIPKLPEPSQRLPVSPPIPPQQLFMEEIETEKKPETTDEQRINELFLRGDYLASITLLRNLIYDELRGGLKLLGKTTPYGMNLMLKYVQENQLYDLDIIDGVEIINKLYDAFRASPPDSTYINKEQFSNALNYGIQIYYQIKEFNDSFKNN